MKFRVCVTSTAKLNCVVRASVCDSRHDKLFFFLFFLCVLCSVVEILCSCQNGLSLDFFAVCLINPDI